MGVRIILDSYQQTGTLALIISLPPRQLTVARWLDRIQPIPGIENGRHGRLDVSLRDDQCRQRNRAAVWAHGILARLATRRITGRVRFFQRALQLVNA